MPVGLIWLLGKPVVVHHLSADEAFQRQRGEHIEAETQSSNLHNNMSLRGEVVQNIAFSLVAEGEEAC